MKLFYKEETHPLLPSRHARGRSASGGRGESKGCEIFIFVLNKNCLIEYDY